MQRSAEMKLLRIASGCQGRTMLPLNSPHKSDAMRFSSRHTSFRNCSARPHLNPLSPS